jgi:hypothetical protein
MSEFLTESIAAEKDLLQQRSLSVANFVDIFQPQPRQRPGIMFNAKNQFQDQIFN